jgi:hypothetical protein
MLIMEDDRLEDLLSEVWHADTQASNPRTRQFLEAGRELLHNNLARTAGDRTARTRIKAPFDELLAWVSRRRVVAQAGARHADTHLSESAFRYRWRRQADYLRDLVIYALRPRLASPEETDKAAAVLDRGGPIDEAIETIAGQEVLALNQSKAFRLQMVFQAILPDDELVADALRRIDDTNVAAWRAFYERTLADRGLVLRPDVSIDDFACALQAAGEGVAFRALLPRAAGAADDQASRPLALIAMALLAACTDPGDNLTLRETLRNRLVPPAGS